MYLCKKFDNHIIKLNFMKFLFSYVKIRQMLQQNTYGMQINETNRSKFEMAQMQIKVFKKKFSKQS